MTFELSEDQRVAVRKATRWYCTKAEQRKPWFRINGGAGMGKTTLIQAIIRELQVTTGLAEQDIRYVAPTGKAALRMYQTGCFGATTIHKLIYKSCGERGAEARDIQAAKAAIEEREAELTSPPSVDPSIDEAKLANDPKLAKLRIALDKLESIAQPLWSMNEASSLTGAKLLVLSEASMVDEDVALDLLKFKVPILLEGDSFQLPPIAGKAYFMRGAPDAQLTLIHRQRAQSPIIEMARLARMGQDLKLGDYGDGCAVVKKLPLELALKANQIICGRNKTRNDKNEGMRKALGFLKPGPRASDWFIPRPGEKLICLRNDNDMGIMNGQMFRCRASWAESESKLQLELRDEDLSEDFDVRCHAELFKGNHGRPLPQWVLRAKGVQQIDFGYVITCHKAQGSQWDFVVVYDQSSQFGDSRQWLYTALTRAAKRLIIVQCDSNG